MPNVVSILSNSFSSVIPNYSTLKHDSLTLQNILHKAKDMISVLRLYFRNIKETLRGKLNNPLKKLILILVGYQFNTVFRSLNIVFLGITIDFTTSKLKQFNTVVIHTCTFTVRYLYFGIAQGHVFSLTVKVIYTKSFGCCMCNA